MGNDSILAVNISQVEGGFRAAVTGEGQSLEAYGATPAKIASSTGKLIRRILEAKK